MPAVLDRPDPDEDPSNQPKKLNPKPLREAASVPPDVLASLQKLYNLDIDPPETGS